MSARRWATALPALLLAVAGTAACGVPTGAAPTTIPPSDVPYGLLATTPSSAPPTAATPQPDQPMVYLVGSDGRLVPRGRPLTGGPPKRELGELLRELAAGPTRDERRAQLTTALPPDVRLALSGWDGDTATVDIVGSTDLEGRSSRVAVGQLVLTATSLPDVTAVRLRRNGEPVEAPLPDGQLTTDPLTAADYSALTSAPPS